MFDVVWPGNRKPEPKRGKLPAIGNTVDLETGKYTNGIGANKLKAMGKTWKFDSHRYAAIICEVLEILRATFMAIESGLRLPTDALPRSLSTCATTHRPSTSNRLCRLVR